MIIYNILFEWVFLYSKDGKQNYVSYKPGGFFSRLALMFQVCIQNPVKHLRCSVLMFQKQLHGGVL